MGCFWVPYHIICYPVRTDFKLTFPFQDVYDKIATHLMSVW